MKKEKAKFPEDAKDLNDFYRRMDREKRIELFRDHLETALYLKKKSDILFNHIAAIVCVTAEEKFRLI